MKLELPDNLVAEPPIILLVGCGRVGINIAKTYIESIGPHVKMYVTDSDKERARKLSEYRLSSILPVKWKNAGDTPNDVDVIVVCVDHMSEKKVIERIVESGKPFVSLTDDSEVYDEYEEYEEECESHAMTGVLGTGLVPGISDALTEHCMKGFDQVLDIVVERLGFVSSTSLASVKQAIKESPMSVRDGILDPSRRSAGSSISWFPHPYNATECNAVAVGVKALHRRYRDVHNITVRYAEPKLPTFSERIRHIFFHTPLTTTRACIRVEVHGVIDGQVVTRTESIAGDAITMIVTTTIYSILSIGSYRGNTVFIGVNDIVDSNKLLVSLYNSGCEISRFEPHPV